MKRGMFCVCLILFLLCGSLVLGATLKGNVYNEFLEVESDVLVEIGTQKLLVKEGGYSFELSPGNYVISARNGEIEVQEKVVVKTGVNVFDLFLLPGFGDEDDLWKDTGEDLFEEEEEGMKIWQYIAAVIIFVYAIGRIIWMRKKHGSLRVFRRKVREDSKKSVEQHKKDIVKEPGYLDRALEIIKKHDGRISQKELRKEMLPLSEAKVSLVVTELEHKGKVERVKKGRGKVILLK